MKNLVCVGTSATVSVVLNISLYYISQMWGQSRREGRRKVRKNEEKCHPVQYRGFSQGWRGQEERITDKRLTSSWKANPKKSWEETGGSDSVVKGKKRLRSDLDTKIPPLSRSGEVTRRGRCSKDHSKILPGLEPPSVRLSRTQGICCTTWVPVALSTGEVPCSLCPCSLAPRSVG